MGYEFEQDATASGAVGRGLALGVRIAGVVLLAAGIWVLLAVLFEVWGLYHEPQRLTPLAQAIGQAGLPGTAPAATADATPLQPLEDVVPPAPPAATDGVGGLSYVAAWPVALLTLLLAGHLALGAIRVGGLLALGAIPWRRRGGAER